MATKIDTIGTYVGTITESVFSLSKKSELPQAVLRIVADKKYVEDKGEIAHFQGQGLLENGEPDYVDYSAFDQDMVAYLSLFDTKNDKPSFNAENLFNATGWQFPNFDQIPALVGKQVLFTVREKKAYTDPETGKTYGGPGELEIGWIDKPDASPTRALKPADADTVKSMMAKYGKFKASAPKPAASAPALAKPAAPAASVPVARTTLSPATATAAATPSTTIAPTASTSVSLAASASPKPAPKRKAKEQPAPAAATAPTQPAALPAETTQAEAWEFVNAKKGQTEDAVVEEAWIAATSEVLADRDEASATGADWAKVRDTVIAKIAA